ncbi:hypothetical protein [Vreelandella sp. TE19]
MARDEVKRVVVIFRAYIIGFTTGLYTVQITGDAAKPSAFLQAVAPDGILKVGLIGGRVCPWVMCVALTR